MAFALALPREREAVRRNLQRLLGPRGSYDEQLDILRTFVAYAHCLAESLGSERRDGRAARCEVSDEHWLEEVLRGTGGFIIGTAHTGAWDIAAQALTSRTGRRVVLVMDREPDAQARELQDHLRNEHGVEVAHVGADALEGLGLLRHLRQGGIVAVQLDRLGAASRSVTVKLGREPFRMPLGPFVLASLAQVPLLPLFVARSGYYKYSIRVHQAVRLPRRPAAGQVEQVAQSIANCLQGFLLENPEQWFNFDPDPVASASL
jgi:KDO2-lipid IV(A) lauroyltransferase